MDISVIVTCLNEEKNISECLLSILNQTYISNQYEIIVADSCSKDRTQEIVHEIAAMHPKIRLVLNFEKGTASGRNAGLKASKYDMVAFIDADCIAPPDWLEILSCNYQELIVTDKCLVAVGGTNIPPDKTSRFVKAIGVCMDSYLGSFTSVQGRRYQNRKEVSSLANLNVLYDKQKLAEIGYYDESLVNEAEDADLNYRLTALGYKMVFIPNSYVWHKMRSTPKKWLQNMFRYGKGRARLLKRYPKMWEPCYFFPLLFIISMMLFLLFPVSNFFFLSLLYFPIIFLFSLLQCMRKNNFFLVLDVMLVYYIQHLGYAAGEVYGLLNPKVT